MGLPCLARNGEGGHGSRGPTWGDDSLSSAGEELRPNPEGDGGLQVLAIVADCGDEVAGDVLIEPPCLAPCNRHTSVSGQGLPELAALA